MDGVEKSTEETPLSKGQKIVPPPFGARRKLFSSLTPEQKRRSEERLSLLCDGIFAIVLTLLVLEIKLPANLPQTWEELQRANPEHPEVAKALFAPLWGHAFSDLLGKSLIYVITFGIIASYWLNHRRLMVLVKEHDGPFTALVFVYLAFVAFYPAAFNLMSEWAGSQVEPVILFTLVLAGTGFFSSSLWAYAGWKHRLFEKNEALDLLQRRLVLNLIPPVFFALSLFLFYLPWFREAPWRVTISWFVIPFTLYLTRTVWNFVHSLQEKSRAANASLGGTGS